jgi:hypothetical protein
MQKKGQETKKILLTPRLQVPSGASAQLVFSRTISVFVLVMVQNCENKSNTRFETSLLGFGVAETSEGQANQLNPLSMKIVEFACH